MLWKCCSQYASKFGKLSSGHRTGKVFIPIPKKGNAKECSNYRTIAFISHANNGTPLQYSWLENPMGGGSWKATVHGIAEGRTRLSNFTFTFHFHPLENEMATHSSVLAWRIPGTGEPDGLPSMGSHRVRHDWCDLAAAAAHTSKVMLKILQARPQQYEPWSSRCSSWF